MAGNERRRMGGLRRTAALWARRKESNLALRPWHRHAAATEPQAYGRRRLRGGRLVVWEPHKKIRQASARREGRCVGDATGVQGAPARHRPERPVIRIFPDPTPGSTWWTLVASCPCGELARAVTAANVRACVWRYRFERRELWRAQGTQPKETHVNRR